MSEPSNTSWGLATRTGEITAIILAGGQSSRFGMDKANALWHGRKMIDHVAMHLRGVAREVIAVSRAAQNADGWRVDRIIHDDPAAPPGPLRGIVRGLEQCRTEWAYVLACDCPLVQPALLLGLR